MDTFQFYTQVISLILGTISVIIIALQVVLASRRLKKDHDRQRKQATVDLLLFKIRPQWRKGRKQLDAKWGRGQLTEDSINNIQTDDQAKDELREFLGTLEHMAVAVHEDVYDIKIIRRASGKYLVDLYHRLEPYIKHLRKTNGPTLSIEFERLAKRIESGSTDRKA